LVICSNLAGTQGVFSPPVKVFLRGERAAAILRGMVGGRRDLLARGYTVRTARLPAKTPVSDGRLPSALVGVVGG
jgi:hypothetical protein